MANRYAVISGSWDNPLIWDGGTTVPGAGDTIYANGYGISIFSVGVITATLLTTAANVGLGIVAGGYFYFQHSTAVTVNANLHSDSPGGYGFLTANTAPLTINGNITNGFNNQYGFYINTAASQVTINGTITNSGTGNGMSVWAGQTVIISGDVTSVNGYGIRVYGVPGSMTINGDVYAGTANGIYHGGSGHTMVINGDVYGSSVQYGVSIQSYPNTITVNGTVKLGGAPGTYSVQGFVNSYEQNTCLIQHMEYRSYGIGGSLLPVAGYVRLFQTGSTVIFILADGTQQVFSAAADVTGQLPAEADVRDGVDFALNTKTGTLKVPLPSQVGSGVPTDNTVGTAVFDPEALFDAIENSPHLIAERLRNVSTVQTTLQQLENTING
jgi:hypothetical protein